MCGNNQLPFFQLLQKRTCDITWAQKLSLLSRWQTCVTSDQRPSQCLECQRLRISKRSSGIDQDDIQYPMEESNNARQSRNTPKCIVKRIMEYVNGAGDIIFRQSRPPSGGAITKLNRNFSVHHKRRAPHSSASISWSPDRQWNSCASLGRARQHSIPTVVPESFDSRNTFVDTSARYSTHLRPVI